MARKSLTSQDMGGNAINNIPTTPSGANDAASKAYVDTKEPAIAVGTSAQYYRGDKTMQTLNQDAVPSGTTNKAYTATEQTKLAGIATGAQVNSFVRVIHGSTAGTARPAGVTNVEWVGSVAPTNADTVNDTWIDTT